MKYFVSADIHSFYDEWIEALNEKQFNISLYKCKQGIRKTLWNAHYTSGTVGKISLVILTIPGKCFIF